MIPELVDQNFRISEAATGYFEELINKLDVFVLQYSERQKQFTAHPRFAEVVAFDAPKRAKDLHGRLPLEYKSSIATLKLYCNEPVGWVYGEIEQHVPWIGRKCFAICPKTNSYTDLAPKVLGCYSFGESFPQTYLLAKKIMIDLSQGDITSEQIEARSKSLEFRLPG